MGRYCLSASTTWPRFRSADVCELPRAILAHACAYGSSDAVTQEFTTGHSGRLGHNESTVHIGLERNQARGASECGGVEAEAACATVANPRLAAHSRPAATARLVHMVLGKSVTTDAGRGEHRVGNRGPGSTDAQLAHTFDPN